MHYRPAYHLAEYIARIHIVRFGWSYSFFRLPRISEQTFI